MVGNAYFLPLDIRDSGPRKVWEFGSYMIEQGKMIPKIRQHFLGNAL